MARGHGRILTSIWDDADFTSLSEEEQRLYFFLLSQTNLNHAGLLPVTLLRWSRKAKGLTPALLADRLGVLEGARFVVADPETEELLIRSYVRNDGVWKQPNVMAAMVSASQEIESPKLRRVLLAEMDRLPLDVLSDEKSSRGGPSTRQQIEAHLANLRQLLVVPDPVPPDPSPIPFGDPSANPSERVPGTPPDAIAEPSTRAGAPAYTRAAPSPSPVPFPITLFVPEIVGAPSISDPDHCEPTRIDVEQACTLLADLVEANGSRRPTITKAWRTSARLMIDKDRIALADVLGAIRWSQADPFWCSNVLSMPKLRKQYDQLRLKALASREQAQQQGASRNPTQAYADIGVY